MIFPLRLEGDWVEVKQVKVRGRRESYIEGHQRICKIPVEGESLKESQWTKVVCRQKKLGRLDKTQTIIVPVGLVKNFGHHSKTTEKIDYKLAK